MSNTAYERLEKVGALRLRFERIIDGLDQQDPNYHANVADINALKQRMMHEASVS